MSGTDAAVAQDTDGEDTGANADSGSTNGDHPLTVTQDGKTASITPGGVSVQYKVSGGNQHGVDHDNDTLAVTQIYFRAANNNNQILVEANMELPDRPPIADVRGKPVTTTESRCTLVFYVNNWGGAADGLMNESKIFPGDCTLDVSSGGLPLIGSFTMDESGTKVSFNFP